jgi:SRSO17 transposase
VGKSTRRRHLADIPDEVTFKLKWQIAIQHVDRVLKSGFQVEAVTADAGYGNGTEFRDELSKRGLHYVVGVKSTTKVFDREPELGVPKQSGSGRPTPRATPSKRSAKPKTLKQLAAEHANAWRRVTWGKGSRGPLTAEFFALRVRPSHGWANGEQHEECWVLCERAIRSKEEVKFHLSNLPVDTSLRDLVRIAHTRWVIEQSYQHFKSEIGLDHFEGRSYPGLHHHMVLTALAYTFLEIQRRSSRAKGMPTLPQMRRLVREIVTMQLFAGRERMSKVILDFMQDPPPI